MYKWIREWPTPNKCYIHSCFRPFPAAFSSPKFSCQCCQSLQLVYMYSITRRYQTFPFRFFVHICDYCRMFNSDVARRKVAKKTKIHCTTQFLTFFYFIFLYYFILFIFFWSYYLLNINKFVISKPTRKPITDSFHRSYCTFFNCINYINNWLFNNIICKWIDHTKYCLSNLWCTKSRTSTSCQVCACYMLMYWLIGDCRYFDGKK